VGFIKGKPLIELLSGNIITLANLLGSVKMCKELRQNSENKEKSITGVGENEIRKDGMGMLTTVAVDTEDT